MNRFKYILILIFAINSSSSFSMDNSNNDKTVPQIILDFKKAYLDNDIGWAKYLLNQIDFSKIHNDTFSVRFDFLGNNFWELTLYISAKDSILGWTPLMWAAAKRKLTSDSSFNIWLDGCIENVPTKILIEKDQTGRNVADIAETFGHKVSAKKLRKNIDSLKYFEFNETMQKIIQEKIKPSKKSLVQKIFCGCSRKKRKEKENREFAITKDSVLEKHQVPESSELELNDPQNSIAFA